MNKIKPPKALFYSSKDRSLFFHRLDKYYRREDGPAMLIVSLEGEMEVTDIAGNKYCARSFLVPAGVPFSMLANYAKVVTCFLKFSGSDYRKMVPHMSNIIMYSDHYVIHSGVKLEDMLIKSAVLIWDSCPSAPDVLNQFDQLVSQFDSLHDKTTDYSVDERVLRAIDFLHDNLTNNVPVSVIADEVGLSASRLSQLFKEATGASIRSVRLWKRVFYAARCLNSGMSLTEAATKAGFSDYGQCYRIYKELGGMHPGKTNKATDVRFE